MKKLLFIAVSVLISTTSFAQKSLKTKYFFIVGWEYSPYIAGSETTSISQPVVTNVFSTNCKKDYLPIKEDLGNQLYDYYAAFLSKGRGFRGVKSTIVFGEYDTYEEAEKDRRIKIADYNYRWNPLLVKNFSASCD